MPIQIQGDKVFDVNIGKGGKIHKQFPDYEGCEAYLVIMNPIKEEPKKK